MMRLLAAPAPPHCNINNLSTPVFNCLIFQLGAPPVDSILLEDLLATVEPKVAIMKIDVEGWECKVIHKLFSNI
jgi:hypothetical protein